MSRRNCFRISADLHLQFRIINYDISYFLYHRLHNYWACLWVLSDVGCLLIICQYEQPIHWSQNELILSVQRQFPNWGNRHMYGHLLSHEIGVQYHRVRESQSCWSRGVNNVTTKKPKETTLLCSWDLWHIDGHHKLWWQCYDFDFSVKIMCNYHNDLLMPHADGRW